MFGQSPTVPKNLLDSLATSLATRRASTFSEQVFLELLDRSVTDATVRFITPGGTRIVGRGGGHPVCTVQVSSTAMFTRALTLRNLGLGESYMDQEFRVVEGELYDLIETLLRNRINYKIKAEPSLLVNIALVHALNWTRGSAGNVQAHYDIGDDLFECFLDSTLTYSCGYAHSDDDDVESLQSQKLDRICRKLELTPGERMLDIGCGFGGLLIHAAKHYGVRGVGITLSRRHCALGGERVTAQGLSSQIELHYRSYKDETQSYDKIVSVGMMEHLRRHEYGPYIRKIGELLTPDGRALVHAIGCNSDRNRHDPFTQKYIFPGSAQPKLSEIASQLERNRLCIIDVENIVRHYAVTCMRWLENFRQGAHRLDPTKYDERFKRMWEYYLCCGVAAARASESSVYQVLFGNNHATRLQYQRV
jgi:cyclopropane-fatty-acyl-phospholipid synthase